MTKDILLTNIKELLSSRGIVADSRGINLINIYMPPLERQKKRARGIL